MLSEAKHPNPLELETLHFVQGDSLLSATVNLHIFSIKFRCSKGGVGDMNQKIKIILPHCSYQKLMSYQMAEIVYDKTANFCKHFIDRRSSTFDQLR
jgi:hypothetical protein